jgi:DNA repair protein RecO (recombination protein O)
VAPVTTQAVLLRSHEYGDTSRILRFYTEALGLLSVVARGVRGRTGKGAAVLSSFASGRLTAWVKPHRDLHTMKDFDAARVRTGIGRSVVRLAGASVAAELVLTHADEEPHPALFSTLEAVLDALESAEEDALSVAALSGGWRLVDALGFAPQLGPCVLCGASITPEEVGRFDFAAGGVRCGRCSEGASGPRVGPIARSQMAALLAGTGPPRLEHARQHAGLLADFVTYHVTSRPLKSLTFLLGVLPDGESRA